MSKQHTPWLGSDRGLRALDTQGPCAWMVVSASANYVGLFEGEFAARQMLDANAAPKDAVMFRLVKDGGAIKKSTGSTT